jgi:hypothetical protein
MASNFVMSFKEEFRREIGLNSETVLAPSTLGTKVIYEELILLKQISPC